jgi:quinol monooxygenase YgiN
MKESAIHYEAASSGREAWPVKLPSAASRTRRKKMIVVRFKMKCKPEKAEQLRAAFEAVVAESRTVQGCFNFDIARDVTDSNSFIATEVFADKEALARQEALPQAKKVIALLPEVAAGEPEETIYHISSSEPWG